MEFIKGFIKLCNKKDWSHLPERRLPGWGNEWAWKIDEKWDYVDDEDIIGEDESEPVDITSKMQNSRDRHEEESRQCCVDEDESEEFSSTEEMSDVIRQRRKRKRGRSGRRRLRENHVTDQLVFAVEL